MGCSKAMTFSDCNPCPFKVDFVKITIVPTVEPVVKMLLCDHSFCLSLRLEMFHFLLISQS